MMLYSSRCTFFLHSFFASAFLCRAYSKIGKNVCFGKCFCSLRLYASHTIGKSGCREEIGLVNLTTESCKALILGQKRCFRRKMAGLCYSETIIVLPLLFRDDSIIVFAFPKRKWPHCSSVRNFLFSLLLQNY